MFATLASFPDRSAFLKLARSGGLVPVVRELVADTLTPVGAYLRLRREGVPSFLLESAEGGERWGRYSVLATAPRATLSWHAGVWTRRENGRAERIEGEPLEALRAELKRTPAVEVPGVPRFSGGLVGYFGYDAVRWFEKIPDRHDAAETSDFPEAVFFRVEESIVFDNARQRVMLVCWTDVAREGGATRAWEFAQGRLDKLVDALEKPVVEPTLKPSKESLKPIARPGGRKQFLAGVERALEYIAAGDVFQVVLSQPFEIEARIPPVQLYRALRAVNPSPYMFLLDLGGPALVGASPELLVKTEQGRSGPEVVVRPIAGTRRRGKTPDEDAALERELRADPKERAEHVMLVDLGRNDAGRVSALGSVRVEDLMVVERYSHVLHLVSQVRGRLAKGRDAFDALAAAFPAGTVSGAPKIRAMEIIDELESARRGPYAGAVGAISFTGEMDLALTIRSARVTADKVVLQAGAGIVADSDPEAEWREIEAKAAGVLRAVQLAGGRS